MNAKSPQECCPPFAPAPWHEQELTWSGKRFVRDRVASIFHIPINFGAVMERNMAAIAAAGAAPEQIIILSDENSLWGADVFIAVSKDMPGANMASISGTFFSKVYEGPYRNLRNWIGDMRRYVAEKGKALEKLYFFYTTCPKCAKKHGKNYVVLLAKIKS